MASACGAILNRPRINWGQNRISLVFCPASANPSQKGGKKLFGMRAFRKGTRASYGRPLKKPPGLFFLGSRFGVSSVRLLAPRAPALAVVSRSPRFRPSLACASFRRLRARAPQGRTAPLRFAPSLCPSASFGFGLSWSPAGFRLALNAVAGPLALYPSFPRPKRFPPALALSPLPLPAGGSRSFVALLLVARRGRFPPPAVLGLRTAVRLGALPLALMQTEWAP